VQFCTPCFAAQVQLKAPLEVGDHRNFFKNWASSDVLQRQIKESEPYKYRELMANLGTILAHTSIAGMHYCSAAVC